MDNTIGILKEILSSVNAIRDKSYDQKPSYTGSANRESDKASNTITSKGGLSGNMGTVVVENKETLSEKMNAIKGLGSSIRELAEGISLLTSKMLLFSLSPGKKSVINFIKQLIDLAPKDKKTGYLSVYIKEVGQMISILSRNVMGMMAIFIMDKMGVPKGIKHFVETIADIGKPKVTKMMNQAAINMKKVGKSILFLGAGLALGMGSLILAATLGGMSSFGILGAIVGLTLAIGLSILILKVVSSKSFSTIIKKGGHNMLMLGMSFVALGLGLLASIAVFKLAGALAGGTVSTLFLFLTGVVLGTYVLAKAISSISKIRTKNFLKGAGLAIGSMVVMSLMSVLLVKAVQPVKNVKWSDMLNSIAKIGVAVLAIGSAFIGIGSLFMGPQALLIIGSIAAGGVVLATLFMFKKITGYLLDSISNIAKYDEYEKQGISVGAISKRISGDLHSFFDAFRNFEMTEETIDSIAAVSLLLSGNNGFFESNYTEINIGSKTRKFRSFPSILSGIKDFAKMIKDVSNKYIYDPVTKKRIGKIDYKETALMIAGGIRSFFEAFNNFDLSDTTKKAIERMSMLLGTSTSSGIFERTKSVSLVDSLMGFSKTIKDFSEKPYYVDENGVRRPINYKQVATNIATSISELFNVLAKELDPKNSEIIKQLVKESTTTIVNTDASGNSEITRKSAFSIIASQISGLIQPLTSLLTLKDNEGKLIDPSKIKFTFGELLAKFANHIKYTFWQNGGDKNAGKAYINMMKEWNSSNVGGVFSKAISQTSNIINGLQNLNNLTKNIKADRDGNYFNITKFFREFSSAITSPVTVGKEKKTLSVVITDTSKSLNEFDKALDNLVKRKDAVEKLAESLKKVSNEMEKISRSSDSFKTAVDTMIDFDSKKQQQYTPLVNQSAPVASTTVKSKNHQMELDDVKNTIVDAIHESLKNKPISVIYANGLAPVKLDGTIAIGD